MDSIENMFLHKLLRFSPAKYRRISAPNARVVEQFEGVLLIFSQPLPNIEIFSLRHHFFLAWKCVYFHLTTDEKDLIKTEMDDTINVLHYIITE